MNCQDVQDWLLTLHPSLEGGIPAVEQSGTVSSAPASVVDHVAGCTHCQQEQRFDAFMRQAMRHVEPAPELASNILWQLRQRRRSAQRASTLYWSMAAAAAFFLAICLHWYVQQPYDLANLSNQVAALDLKQPANSLMPDELLEKEQLIQWFKRQGVAVTIPKRLKLQHVAALFVVESGGRKVAVLDLRLGGSTGKVCLLERRYFRADALRSLAENLSLSSFVITDSDEADTLGWMIVDRASAHLFVEGDIPEGGA